MDISASCVPTTLFSKFSKGRRQLEDQEPISECLFGNPYGLGKSSVPYIYCISSKQMKSCLQDIYHLELSFKWPVEGRFKKETCITEHMSYENHLAENYLGCLRLFEDGQRYVVFNPMDFVVRIKDLDTDKVLYQNEALSGNLKNVIPGNDWVRVSDYFSDTHEKEQHGINTLMLQIIGPQYIDMKRDYFSISEIARRKCVSKKAIEKYLSTLINRITVNKKSGCWVSKYKSDYRRTFWLSKGGVNFSDIFYFPRVINSDSVNVVIKNRDILHSTLCETTLGSEHMRCCRPFHLKLGTSRENAIHIKIRKSLTELMDFDFETMQEYSYLILRLSNLIEKQIHTVTTEEAKVQLRKSNRILYLDDKIKKQKYVEVCGEPDMGDLKTHPSIEEIDGNKSEESDSELWSIYNDDDEDECYEKQYKEKLQNS